MMWRHALGLIVVTAVLVAMAVLPVLVHSDSYEDAFVSSIPYMR
jgi:hypothetical protein